jgi:cytochrome c
MNRKFAWGIAAVVVVGVVSMVVMNRVRAQSARVKEAADALAKAIALGKATFADEAFGTNGKSCRTCHEDPEKPNLNLASRIGDFPKWDRREKKVVTIGQKMNQMIEMNLKGKPEGLGSEKLVALEAYLMSIRQDD